MFTNVVDSYEQLIIGIFGYKAAVIVEEILFGVGMFAFGVIVMGFISAYFILRLHSLEDFGASQVKVVRVDNGKKSERLIKIRNLKEAFEQLMILSFSPFFTIDRYTGRDERRTKRFLRLTCVIALIILLFAAISAFSVLGP